MYSARYYDSAGGERERIILGMMQLGEAIALAKAQFMGVQVRNPQVVGFRVFDNEGNEAAQWNAAQA
jgi:hypothetical protein